MAPDGPDLHAADRLPDILATVDLIWPNDLSAVCRDDAGRHGRRLLIDAEAGPAEHGKREHDDRGEREPQLPHAFSPTHADERRLRKSRAFRQSPAFLSAVD